MAGHKSGGDKKKRELMAKTNPRGTKRGGKKSKERFKVLKALFLKDTSRTIKGK